jgi:O-antigen/teichoic acid export membrane protein
MINKNFFRNNLIYLSSIVIGGALGYLFNFMLARNLTVAQFGEFQSLVSIMMIFSVLTSAFSYFIIKYSAVFAIHNDKNGQLRFIDFLKQKFSLPALLSLVLFVAMLPLIKSGLHLEDYWGIVMVGMTLLLSFYASFYSNSLQGWSSFTVLSFIGVAAAIAKLASGYLVMILFPGSSSAVLSFLVSVFVVWQLAKYFIEKRWDIGNIENKKIDDSWKEKYFSEVNFKKSFINILFFSAGLMALGNLDIIIVKNIVDAQTAGYYGALSVLGKIILSLNMAFIGVLFPDACADGYRQQPAKIQSVIGSYFLVVGMSLPVVAVFYFYPGTVIRSLFGDKYLDIASNLWIFGVMAFFLSFITLEAKLALARHDFRSTWILIATALIFSGGIYWQHDSLKSIILAVTFSLAAGWMGIMALNLFDRWKSGRQIGI